MVERLEAAAVEASEIVASSAATRAGTRRAYFAIALLLASIVAWGFWRTYYSQITARGDLPSIVHLHAAVFSAWVLLLVAQAGAVAAGRVALHRRIGSAGMLFGALVFAVGLLVSVGAPALRVRSGQFPLDVGASAVLYNLMDMLLFGAFLALAFTRRRQPELHKRWIIAATAALCGAAIGRVLPVETPQYLLLWLSPIFAMILVDLVVARRVYAISVIAGGLLVAAFFKVPLLAAPIWLDIGRSLLSPFV